MNKMKKSTSKPDILYEGKYLRFISDGDWEYVTRHNCTGIVIIVAMTDDQRVIFVEQYRPPVRKHVVEFPAGLVNDQDSKGKESLVSAARRELIEETGYTALKITKLIEGPVSGGSSADMVTILRAEGLRKISRGGGDETESIKVHEIPLEQVDAWLDRMRRRGRAIEPKIYTGLYFLKSYNKKSIKK